MQFRIEVMGRYLDYLIIQLMKRSKSFIWFLKHIEKVFISCLFDINVDTDEEIRKYIHHYDRMYDILVNECYI